MGFADGWLVGQEAAGQTMALAQAQLTQLRQQHDSPWARFVLVNLDDDPRVQAAQFRGVQVRLCRRWGLEDDQLALFAGEGEATVVALQSMLLRSATRDVVLCSPTRPALAQALALCGIMPHDVPRDAHGLPQPDAWVTAVKRNPDSIFVVNWEPESGAELEVALQAGVRAEQMMLLAGQGFVGQLPWPMEIRPAVAVAALRDPDAPQTPLAWVSADFFGRMTRLKLGAASAIAQPTLATLELVLHTLDTWPAWTNGAVALLEERAGALNALVQGHLQLTHWPRLGGEALIHCTGSSPQALADEWRTSGWVCKLARHSVYGDFIVVDLLASQPALAASKEWTAWP